MSVEEVLPRLIKAKYDESPAHRYPQEGPLAEFILAGLKAAGFAVVELPKPTDPTTYDFGESCSAAWFIGEDDEGDALDVAVFGETVEISIPTDDNRFDVECARVVAGALLAAADVAEATNA